MVNIILFILTTSMYFFTFCLINSGNFIGLRAWSKNQLAKKLGIIALLCLPVNLNGNVITVLGNAESDKNIYSLFSFYQKAEVIAISVFGAAYQSAGKDAIIGIGISGIQKAKENAIIVAGVSVKQEAQKGSSFHFLGINFFQKSVEKDCLGFVVLTPYQEAGANVTNFASIVGYQKSGRRAVNFLGIAGYQEATEEAGTILGIALIQRAKFTLTAFGAVVYQNANERASAGVALLQKTRGKERAFAFFSDLKEAN